MRNVWWTFALASMIFTGNVSAQEALAEGVSYSSDPFYSGMTEGVSCYRIPSLVTASNGDLVAAIDERVPSCGDLRMSRDINIVIRRSTDNGRSWQPPVTVVDFPIGQSASDPSMIVDHQTGEIFLFYNYMDLDKEPDIYYLHVVKSADNGRSWSKPRDITQQISKQEWKKDFKFITSGRGICTSDGKLLHTMVDLQQGLHVFGSDNHGESWYLIDTPVKPADESKIVELSDGRWMINSRISEKKMRCVHVSSDQGKSWVSWLDSTLIDPNCNGSIISYTRKADNYNKDRLLFSNANNSTERQNLTVRVSYDDGRTWSAGKTIYAGLAAYSSLSVLENGDIAVFFEKDDYTINEVVVFTLEWLTDGKDMYEKPAYKM